MEATSGGYVEVGRVLLDYGADVDAPPVPSSRDTAFTIASDKCRLCRAPIATRSPGRREEQERQLTSMAGHLKVVELLFKAKADIDSQVNIIIYFSKP